MMASAGRTSRGWYHGWNIVIVCILAGFAANSLAINCFSLFLREWSRDFDAKISSLQVGIAGIGFLCALVSPLVGMLVDKVAPRFILAAGLVALAALAFGISHATSARAYLLLYTFVGPFALAMATSIPANAMIVRYFVRHRGLALALTSVGLGLAGVIMPPIIARLLPTVGWRAIWLGLGIISLVVLLPLVLLVVRDRRPSDGTAYLGGTAAAPLHGAHGASTLSIGDILRRRTFWLLVCAYLPMLAIYGGGGQNLAPIAASRGLSQDSAGLFLSLFSGAHVLAMLAGGTLSDRIGNRLPLAGLAFIAAAGGLLVATTTNPVLLGLGAIGIGCGGAFWPLLASAIALEFGAGGVGRAFGMLTLFLPVTGLVPFAVAKLQEGSGSYAPVLYALAAATFAGGIAALLIRERRAPVAADAIGGTLAEPALGPA